MGGVLIGVEGKHDIYQRQTTKTVSNIKLSIAYEINHDNMFKIDYITTTTLLVLLYIDVIVGPATRR